jgi:hypothetical protein
MKAWLDYFADKTLDGLVWLSRFVTYNLAIFLSFVWRGIKELYARREDIGLRAKYILLHIAVIFIFGFSSIKMLLVWSWDKIKKHW